MPIVYVMAFNPLSFEDGMHQGSHSSSSNTLVFILQDSVDFLALITYVKPAGVALD